MKIYTKQGDKGSTGLQSGEVVLKNHPRIQAYGTVDELNSVLGLALTEGAPEVLEKALVRTQQELFRLGAELATPPGKDAHVHLISDHETELLEADIDLMEAAMQPLRSFILPGGTRCAAFLHLARTVCRRGEREVVGLHQHEAVRLEVLRYLNRLGDYLFVAARYANAMKGQPDRPWTAK